MTLNHRRRSVSPMQQPVKKKTVKKIDDNDEEDIYEDEISTEKTPIWKNFLSAVVIIVLISTAALLAYPIFDKKEIPKDDQNEYKQTWYEEIIEVTESMREEKKTASHEGQPMSQPFNIPKGEVFLDVAMSDDKETYTVWSQSEQGVVARTFNRETEELVSEVIER